MSGLLYKDFLCIKGKKMCIFLAVQFLLVVALRFPGSGLEDADLFVMVVYVLFITVTCGYVTFLDLALFRQEKGAKEKRYYFSMPISKVQYVREKYLFVLLVLYSLLSVGYFEGMVCRVNYSEKYVKLVDPVIQAYQGMLLPFACIVLFFCAIELAFMFALGAERGMQAKVILMVLLFMAFLTYMLFGDLTKLDKIDLHSWMEYLGGHPEFSMLLSILFVAVGGGSYWLSYLFSVKRFVGREDWLDD